MQTSTLPQRCPFFLGASPAPPKNAQLYTLGCLVMIQRIKFGTKSHIDFGIVTSVWGLQETFR